MAHSYVVTCHHCVWSTKGRGSWITDVLAERFWPYMGGIARENKFHALAVGGVADHVHVLVSLPATIAMAKAVQLIKGGSSKWVHDTFPEHRHFEWQEGYGAFTIGISQKETTIRYIQNQKEHHRRRRFRRSL